MARMRDVRHHSVKQSFTNGSLAGAQARLIEACGGPKRVAELLGRSVRQVQRYIAPGDALYMTVDDVFALETVCDRMFVTGWLAQAQHAALLKLPADAHHRGLHARASKAGAKAAAFFAAYTEHCGDGVKLTPANAAELSGLTQEWLSALSDLFAVLRKSA